MWLNNKDVPERKSRKFHEEWTGPYVVLSRLGNVNCNVKPEGGKGRMKVVHPNRLKLVKGDVRDETGFSEPSTTKQGSVVDFLFLMNQS